MDRRLPEGIPRSEGIPYNCPLLSPSMLGEELYLYLVVTTHAVSSALIREKGRMQKSVCYTSRVLRGAKG